MSDKIEAPKDLLEKLAKDPKYIERVQKSYELESFKSKYGVSGSSGLRCPACNQYGQSGGSLWGPREGTDNEYVCRKCELVWMLRCLSKSVKEVIREVKGGQKG